MLNWIVIYVLAMKAHVLMVNTSPHFYLVIILCIWCMLDFAQLKTQYQTILHLMPDDYEQSVGKLQDYITDEQICTILCSGSNVAANKLILDFLITRMSCKEDQLDLCDQLEKIATASDELKMIIQQLRSGAYVT